jgi:hypothetical protein
LKKKKFRKVLCAVLVFVASFVLRLYLPVLAIEAVSETADYSVDEMISGENQTTADADDEILEEAEDESIPPGEAQSDEEIISYALSGSENDEMEESALMDDLDTEHDTENNEEELMRSMAQSEEGVAIDEMNFPDDNFREFVKTYDSDSDGKLQQNELRSATTMDCSGKEIADLRGIEYFTWLRRLDCSRNNRLCTLNLSYNNVLDPSETNVRRQTAEIPLLSTWSGGRYEFDLSDIVGVDDIVNISCVRQKDGDAGHQGSDLPTSASYDEITGILSVDASEKIPGIVYDYDIKLETSLGRHPGLYSMGRDMRMDVAVDLIYRFNVILNPDNGLESPQLIAEINEGDSYTYILPECTFSAPTGKVFKVWEVNGVEKQPGESSTFTDHAEIKAVWEILTFSVTYQDEDGNTIGMPQIVGYSKDASPEAVPEKEGYTGKWDHDGKNITADTVIKPVYTEVKMIEQPPEWTKDSSNPASFTSNAEFVDFLYVTVDGEVIDEDNYEVKEGSTIVTLKPAFLETLSVGKHTVGIVSKTGIATGEIEIKASDTPKTVEQAKPSVKPSAPVESVSSLPKTGEAGPALWHGLLLLIAGSVLLLSRRSRILRQKD